MKKLLAILPVILAVGVMAIPICRAAGEDPRPNFLVLVMWQPANHPLFRSFEEGIPWLEWVYESIYSNDPSRLINPTASGSRLKTRNDAGTLNDQGRPVNPVAVWTAPMITRGNMEVRYEGGIATPLICHWPRGIEKPGRISHQPGHVMDLMSTLLDITGAAYPATYNGHAIKPPEGLSFAPVFRGERRKEHAYLFWEHTGNQGVRAGDWKLVATRNARDGWELYDLAADRTELRNRATEFPDKVRDLSSRYERWARDVGVISFDEARKRRSER